MKFGTFKLNKLIAITLVILVMAWPAVGAAEKQAPSSKAEVQMSFAPLVKSTAPAVVNIYARKVVRQRGQTPLFDDPFFRRFFGQDFAFGQPQKRVQNSLGSGVIVRSDGLIVTNKHVIEGADQINVVLADRREFSATLVITDASTDLAVLQVDTGGKPLPMLELSDSDDLEVGDLVLAIGNPFGVGQTVTSGIVSALARTRVTSSDFNFFIQTDAAINPGNSGGALVSLGGKLVGVNSAIFSKSGGSLGIGFAIPANMVRAVLNGITRDGRLVRPWLGAAGQSINQDIATSLGLPLPSGVLISNIYKGAAAAAAGLRVGDVVMTLDGHEVNDQQALRYRIATLPVGSVVPLRVWRLKKVLELTLTLAPPPETPPRNVMTLDGQQPLSGARVANMSPGFAIEIGLDPFARGVMIVDLQRGAPAHRLGFQIGDMVRTVNGEKVASVAQLQSLASKKAASWEVTFERGGKVLNLVIRG
ncbi:MAG: Do family serine endopeptidase [Proteobacteria bacterium]|nr:Do family serine endopeptidase [Pseudomonadota bacterium]